MDFNPKDLIAVIILVFLIGIGSYFLYSHQKNNSSVSEPTAISRDKTVPMKKADIILPKDNNEFDTIIVYINGGIKNPGLYEVKSGSRLFELVKIAGGFTEQAVYKNLNPARKLADGEKIVIPELLNKEDIKNKVIEEKDLAVYSMEREQTEKRDGTSNNKTEIKQAEEKININKASLEELQNLPRIGEKTAQLIIDYREKHNGFKNIEELREVPRIGEKTFEGLKDKVILK